MFSLVKTNAFLSLTLYADTYQLCTICFGNLNLLVADYLLADIVTHQNFSNRVAVK